ncbi:exonuclease family protein, partial [Escherichia coli EC1862]
MVKSRHTTRKHTA